MSSAPGFPPESDVAGPRTRIAAVVALSLLSLVTLSVLAVLVLTKKHSIPSTAMSPTLISGDVAAFWPIAFAGVPQRGDLTTFEVGDGQGTIYIKRVIGLPGERISLSKGIVSINGMPVSRSEVPVPAGVDKEESERAFQETLPGGRSFVVLDNPDAGPLDDMAEITLPADQFFLMGDRRDNSNDSRGSVGTVSRGSFQAKAGLIYFSQGNSGIRFDRIGTWVL